MLYCIHSSHWIVEGRRSRRALSDSGPPDVSVSRSIPKTNVIINGLCPAKPKSISDGFAQSRVSYLESLEPVNYAETPLAIKVAGEAIDANFGSTAARAFASLPYRLCSTSLSYWPSANTILPPK